MGNITEKHVKMTVLDNQAKIQQVQPKYREVKQKKSWSFLKLRFIKFPYSEVGVFGSTDGIR
ncbi:MAG: hypothetical protein DRP81_09085 [Candidatus Omnitrophota bacterium]|nr:MAG: hypothetical protein DRP81_09085 [Candidatus Omnitrophota bacterium]